MLFHEWFSLFTTQPKADHRMGEKVAKGTKGSHKSLYVQFIEALIFYASYEEAKHP